VRSRLPITAVEELPSLNFLEDSGHCVFTWVSRKTDRLEQRQGGGETQAAFFVLERRSAHILCANRHQD